MDVERSAVHISKVGEPGDNEWCYNVWSSNLSALCVRAEIKKLPKNLLSLCQEHRVFIANFFAFSDRQF